MAIGASLRAVLPGYLPTWLGNVPGFRNLFSLLWTLALIGDQERQIALEGQFAAYPGVGTPTAIPYLAASRGLLQGPSESDALFVVRLLNFRAAVKTMGAPLARAQQLQAFLVGVGNLGAGVYPVVRCIDRAGRMVTLDAAGNATIGTSAWHWDDSGGWVDFFGYQTPAKVATYWSDVWVLIQDPFTHYTSFADPNWLAAWGSGDQTVDFLCPQAIVSGVEAICSTWKGDHIYVRNVTWCPDPVAFAPDGHYGNSSKLSAGNLEQIAARAVVHGGVPAFSYWEPEALG
jgi:hypothetical protein